MSHRGGLQPADAGLAWRTGCWIALHARLERIRGTYPYRSSSATFARDRRRRDDHRRRHGRLGSARAGRGDHSHIDKHFPVQGGAALRSSTRTRGCWPLWLGRLRRSRAVPVGRPVSSTAATTCTTTGPGGLRPHQERGTQWQRWRIRTGPRLPSEARGDGRRGPGVRRFGEHIATKTRSSTCAAAPDSTRLDGLILGERRRGKEGGGGAVGRAHQESHHHEGGEGDVRPRRQQHHRRRDRRREPFRSSDGQPAATTLRRRCRRPRRQARRKYSEKARPGRWCSR